MEEREDQKTKAAYEQASTVDCRKEMFIKYNNWKWRLLVNYEIQRKQFRKKGRK